MSTRNLPPEKRHEIASRAAQVRWARERSKAAERAVDDPAALAWAARIVRIALERGRVQLADLGQAPGDEG